jgi:hypothetical protein
MARLEDTSAALMHDKSNVQQPERLGFRGGVALVALGVTVLTAFGVAMREYWDDIEKFREFVDDGGLFRMWIESTNPGPGAAQEVIEASSGPDVTEKPGVPPETPKPTPPAEPAPKAPPTPQPTPEPAPTPAPAAAEPEVAPVVEKPRFVSADTYQLSELNLGGVDTNGDGCLDGDFTRLSETPVEYPTDDQTYILQERLSREEGIELSDRECAEAIRAGGFEKDGKTYELWVSKSDPNVIEIVPVNAGHALVGDVPVFDHAPDEPTLTEEQIQQVTDETFGYTDRCGNIVPGSGEQVLDELKSYVGIQDASFYRYGPNPFDPRDPRYTVWQEIHMFMNRNRI